MQRSIMCSECNIAQTTKTDPQSGEIICGSCGLVVLDKIPVRGPEWIWSRLGIRSQQRYARN